MSQPSTSKARAKRAVSLLRVQAALAGAPEPNRAQRRATMKEARKKR